MTSLEYYIEQVEQFISMLTDDIKSGDGTVVTQTKLAVYREVLEHLEEIEQEPCEDAISRQAVDTLIDELARAISDERCCISRGRSTATIMRDICHLSSVNPQPKTGKWIYKSMEGTFCSECDEPSVWKFNYCPNCGAKMI